MAFIAACALAARDESLTELIQHLPSNCTSLPSDQVLIEASVTFGVRAF
jgi:hypothetical protein